MLRPLVFYKCVFGQKILCHFDCQIAFLLQVLADMLKVNTTLRTLYLEKNQIGDIGVEAQRFASSEGTFLISITVDFTICCPQALANAMQHNTTLTHLDLSWNKSGDKGVEARVFCNFQFLSDFTCCTSQALANVLQHNKSLTDLDLDSNPFRAAGRQAR